VCVCVFTRRNGVRESETERPSAREFASAGAGSTSGRRQRVVPPPPLASPARTYRMRQCVGHRAGGRTPHPHRRATPPLGHDQTPLLSSARPWPPVGRSVGRPVRVRRGAPKDATSPRARVRDDRTARVVSRARDNRNEDRFIVAEKPTSKCARARLYVSSAVYIILQYLCIHYVHYIHYIPCFTYVFIVFYRQL